MSAPVKTSDRPATWQTGLGDGFTLAVELVVTPFIFAALGWWLDGLLNLKPVLAVTLGGLGFVGCVIRTYYAYRARCELEDADKPWIRRYAANHRRTSP